MSLNIREARKMAGMTQKELAVEIGVTQAAVAQWEAGKATPSLPFLIRCSQVLKCTLDSLVGVPGKSIVPDSFGEGER